MTAAPDPFALAAELLDPPPQGVTSREGSRLLADLMALAPQQRGVELRGLAPDDREAAFDAAGRELGTRYGLWVDDPVGFATDVLRLTLYSKQRAVIESVATHKRTAVPSSFGAGKCWHPDALIPLADGRVLRAADMVGRAETVLAWGEKGEQVPRRAMAAWNVYEPTLRVVLSDGREVVRNADHPLWAARLGRARHVRVTDLPQGWSWRAAVDVRGWTPIGSLLPGDLVLVPEWHRAEGTQRVPDPYPLLAGYLLGDGGTSQPNGVTFTQQAGPALEEFRNVCTALGCTVRPKPKADNYTVIDARPRGRAQGERNRVLRLVREWGLSGHTARDKRFPTWVWTTPNGQIAALLGRLFACDGWATIRADARNPSVVLAEIGISLASEGMIRDVERAMLRLGIPGRVRHRRVKYLDGHRDAWGWAARDREAITRFAEQITVPGKEARVMACADAVRERRSREHRWMRDGAPRGYRWAKVVAVENYEAAMTVAIEVEGEHTLVSEVVEHNTTLAGGAIVPWWVAVHPIGTAVAATTAPTLGKLKTQLWPHVAAAQARASLPGVVDQTQWRLPTNSLRDFLAAYAIAAPPTKEDALQGIHAPYVLIVVDEAGGIGAVPGESVEAALTGEGARALIVGNPPLDEERGWFERTCEKERVNVIRLGWKSTPNATGEGADGSLPCRTCPMQVPAHSFTTHLIDEEWVDNAVSDWGEDSNYVRSKVHALFPQGGPSKTIPASWIEGATLPDLTVESSTWVRLGVDVAAGGGDEFSIARWVGNVGEVRHRSSGPANANAVDVAGVVLVHIREAQTLADSIASVHAVRVKVDVVGVGWGVYSLLVKWAEEGKHRAEVVPVGAGETAKDSERYANRRAEMWWEFRLELQPSPETCLPSVALPNLDRLAAAQLGAPTYGHTSSGKVVIEPKESIKKRGLPSPDRAEALILGRYEPKGMHAPARVVRSTRRVPTGPSTSLG